MIIAPRPQPTPSNSNSADQKMIARALVATLMRVLACSIAVHLSGHRSDEREAAMVKGPSTSVEVDSGALAYVYFEDEPSRRSAVHLQASSEACLTMPML